MFPMLNNYNMSIDSRSMSRAKSSESIGGSLDDPKVTFQEPPTIPETREESIVNEKDEIYQYKTRGQSIFDQIQGLELYDNLRFFKIAAVKCGQFEDIEMYVDILIEDSKTNPGMFVFMAFREILPIIKYRADLFDKVRRRIVEMIKDHEAETIRVIRMSIQFSPLFFAGNSLEDVHDSDQVRYFLALKCNYLLTALHIRAMGMSDLMIGFGLKDSDIRRVESLCMDILLPI